VKILCVCYTNHQLDQFLEEILDAGITSIVRIGGQSQSPKLSENQLHAVVTNANTVFANRSFVSHNRDLRTMIESQTEEIEQLQTKISKKRFDKATFDEFIDVELMEQFEFYSDDGFILQGRKGQAIRDSDDLFEFWRSGGTMKHLTGRDLWTRNLGQRLTLLRQWETEIRDKLIDICALKSKAISKLQEEKRSLQDMRTVHILNDAKVIGCTATGAAIHRSLFSQTQCNVLMIEEAGEILEGHLLSILHDRIEKVVMIGDHKQLRPKVNDYELTVESGHGYDLNRSTFERLILSGHPYICLETQHRMRPEISTIVRTLCYNSLRDGDRVLRYPSVKGLQKDVVFVKHYSLEEQEKTFGTASSKLIKSGSKVNKHEVELIVATALYLRQQGYGPDDIVILTPYLGQLVQINRELSKKNVKAVLGDLDANDLDAAFDNDAFNAVDDHVSLNDESKQTKSMRVSTVDNFQGEQAPIILASLVRSNLNDEIGFVKNIERINVLISRAQIGLIVFGNDHCLKRKSPSWTKALSYFNCCDGLPVVCSRHGTRAVVCDPKDFQKLTPQGGCQRPCDALLPCGHQCSLQCHDSETINHGKCQVPVAERCSNQHELWRLCSQDHAPPCKEQIVDTCQKSKHQFLRQCCLHPNQIKCSICIAEELLHVRKLKMECEKTKRLAKIK
jgi:hypothetical protein